MATLRAEPTAIETRLERSSPPRRGGGILAGNSRKLSGAATTERQEAPRHPSMAFAPLLPAERRALGVPEPPA